MATANFIGVYSSQTGSRRQNARKRYWFVWDDLRGGFIVQLLDAAYKPVDEPRTVKRDDFSERFAPEPTIYVSPLSRLELPDFDEMPPGAGYGGPGAPGQVEYAPAPRGTDPETPAGELGRASATANTHATSAADGVAGADATGFTGKDPLVELAADLDLELRSEFALALARLQRGDKASAVNTFEKIAARREGIIPAHKHMFTDFGVYMRKGNLPSVSFKFYQRALELAPEDSNAYFNVARIMFELGDYEGSEQHLHQALHLDQQFDEARRFLEFVVQSRSKRSGRGAKKRNSVDTSLFSLK